MKKIIVTPQSKRSVFCHSKKLPLAGCLIGSEISTQEQKHQAPFPQSKAQEKGGCSVFFRHQVSRSKPHICYANGSAKSSGISSLRTITLSELLWSVSPNV